MSKIGKKVGLGLLATGIAISGCSEKNNGTKEINKSKQQTNEKTYQILSDDSGSTISWEEARINYDKHEAQKSMEGKLENESLDFNDIYEAGEYVEKELENGSWNELYPCYEEIKNSSDLQLNQEEAKYLIIKYFFSNILKDKLKDNKGIIFEGIIFEDVSKIKDRLNVIFNQFLTDFFENPGQYGKIFPLNEVNYLHNNCKLIQIHGEKYLIDQVKVQIELLKLINKMILISKEEREGYFRYISDFTSIFSTFVMRSFYFDGFSDNLIIKKYKNPHAGFFSDWEDYKEKGSNYFASEEAERFFLDSQIEKMFDEFN